MPDHLHVPAEHQSAPGIKLRSGKVLKQAEAAKAEARDHNIRARHPRMMMPHRGRALRPRRTGQRERLAPKGSHGKKVPRGVKNLWPPDRIKRTRHPEEEFGDWREPYSARPPHDKRRRWN